MAVLRPHLALTVTDVERSIPFYEALFGTPAEKRRPGFVRFSLTEPALNLTLTQGRRSQLGAFNHAGIQVSSAAEVLAAKERLVAAGLATFDEFDVTCCYARQDKIWVRDPDGTPWEIFATHEDTDEQGTGAVAPAERADSCGCDSREVATVCCAEVTGCCA